MKLFIWLPDGRPFTAFHTLNKGLLKIGAASCLHACVRQNMICSPTFCWMISRMGCPFPKLYSIQLVIGRADEELSTYHTCNQVPWKSHSQFGLTWKVRHCVQTHAHTHVHTLGVLFTSCDELTYVHTNKLGCRHDYSASGMWSFPAEYSLPWLPFPARLKSLGCAL